MGAAAAPAMDFHNVSLWLEAAVGDYGFELRQQRAAVMFLNLPAIFANRQNRQAFVVVTPARHKRFERFQPVRPALVCQCGECTIDGWRGNVRFVFAQRLQNLVGGHGCVGCIQYIQYVILSNGGLFAN